MSRPDFTVIEIKKDLREKLFDMKLCRGESFTDLLNRLLIELLELRLKNKND